MVCECVGLLVGWCGICVICVRLCWAIYTMQLLYYTREIHVWVCVLKCVGISNDHRNTHTHTQANTNVADTHADMRRKRRGGGGVEGVYSTQPHDARHEKQSERAHDPHATVNGERLREVLLLLAYAAAAAVDGSVRSSAHTHTHPYAEQAESTYTHTQLRAERTWTCAAHTHTHMRIHEKVVPVRSACEACRSAQCF